jgi:hypothetical protein
VVPKGGLARFCVADYKNVEILELQYFKCINENNGSREVNGRLYGFQKLVF